MQTIKYHNEEVFCRCCCNIQTERVADDDKFAWKCEKCESVWENYKPHLLQEIARYTVRHGGNVCVGFGGLAGETSHRVVRKRD